MARALIVALVAACSGGSAPTPDAGPPTGALELVGHSDLGGRGMNSAPAIVGDHLYVGSRTDGANHPGAGIQIVDISDPAAPTLVGMIGAPLADVAAMSSRELRAVPHKNQLVVLTFACGEIHDCSGSPERDTIRVLDVSNPTAPVLAGSYEFGGFLDPARPHEFFLWQDPADADRVLLFLSTPIGPPAFQVLDISDPAAITAAYTWDPIADGGLPVARNEFSVLHSVAVSDDGQVGYFSSEGAGFYLVDTADIAAGVAAESASIELLTPGAQRLDYSPPHPTGTHSAVPVPGRDLVVITDEVYPTPEFPGCPWGWMRVVDVSDPAAPVITGEFKHEKNLEACAADRGPERVTYTAHNATNTETLSFVTWHAAGLQVIELSDPQNPRRIAEFIPEPIAAVTTEDPVLGGHPVLMWSTPLIRDGLIYAIDIRNGLYILRYTGDFAEEVTGRAFAEGNSNL